MSPTDRLIRSVKAYLGDQADVVFALRVDCGKVSLEFARKRNLSSSWLMYWPVFAPIGELLRRRSGRRRLKDDPTAGMGILALTDQRDRILMSAHASRRMEPTAVVATLERGAQLVVDTDYFATHLVPILDVGGREFVVDSVDFKAMLKAIRLGKLNAPQITANLDRLEAVGEMRYGRLPVRGRR